MFGLRFSSAGTGLPVPPISERFKLDRGVVRRRQSAANCVKVTPCGLVRAFSPESTKVRQLSTNHWHGQPRAQPSTGSMWEDAGHSVASALVYLGMICQPASSPVVRTCAPLHHGGLDVRSLMRATSPRHLVGLTPAQSMCLKLQMSTVHAQVRKHESGCKASILENQTGHLVRQVRPVLHLLPIAGE